VPGYPVRLGAFQRHRGTQAGRRRQVLDQERAGQHAAGVMDEHPPPAADRQPHALHEPAAGHFDTRLLPGPERHEAADLPAIAAGRHEPGLGRPVEPLSQPDGAGSRRELLHIDPHPPPPGDRQHGEVSRVRQADLQASLVSGQRQHWLAVRPPPPRHHAGRHA
jgi:hypothetical protein